jgi:hypothetical protein
MNGHAAPSDPHDADAAPEPTYAERARTLVYLGRVGMLSTVSRRHPGHPFGSVAPYALDRHGRPVLLISTMAIHTHNLQADRRASLLVTQPGWTGDPLAATRVTLLGTVEPVAAPEIPASRHAYLERHPNAAAWVDFDDFRFHRLELVEIYVVGGFAAMDWVSAADYLAAHPDPLADAAPAIIERTNRDHPDALAMLARVVTGGEVEQAVMVSVDRLGFRLRVRSGPRILGARIPFPIEVATAEQCRAALLEMFRAAREHLAP